MVVTHIFSLMILIVLPGVLMERVQEVTAGVVLLFPITIH